MDEDWASDGEDGDGLGDISAIPEVEVPNQPSPPKSEASEPQRPLSPPPPPPNAWGSATESGDVRASLARIRSHPPPARGARRDNFSNQLGLQPAPPGMQSPLNNRARGTSNSRGGVALYLTNLPFNTTEADISSFFTNAQFPPTDIRIMRHQDSGKVRGATVTLRPDAPVKDALALHGMSFGGRPLNVRIDGGERDHRRRHNQFHQQGRVSSDRLSNLSSHSGFVRHDDPSSRSPRQSGRRPPGVFSDRIHSDRGQLHDRTLHITQSVSDHVPNNAGNLSQLPVSLPQDPRDRGDRRGPDTDRPGRLHSRKSNLPADPTIPTGPIPTGRKKLELKPRTKPPPVLEIDQRLIDDPKVPVVPPIYGNPRAKPERNDLEFSPAPKVGSSQTSAPVLDSAPERNSERTSDSIPTEPLSTPKTTLVQEPMSSPESTPAPESAPALESEPTPEPVPISESAPASEPTTGSESAATSAPKPVLTSELSSEISAGSASDAAPATSANTSSGGSTASSKLQPPSSLPGRRPSENRPTSERYSRRPAPERVVSGRSTSERTPTLERSPSTRGNPRNGRRTPQEDRMQRNDRNRRGGRHGSNDRGAWKSAKEGTGAKAFNIANVTEKKSKEPRKFTSVNPFAALDDDVDGDNADF